MSPPRMGSPVPSTSTGRRGPSPPDTPLQRAWADVVGPVGVDVSVGVGEDEEEGGEREAEEEEGEERDRRERKRLRQERKDRKARKRLWYAEHVKREPKEEGGDVPGRKDPSA